MIRIKPTTDHRTKCLSCGGMLKPKKVLWPGIHVCVDSACIECGSEFIVDFPIGHALFEPYAYSKDTKLATDRGPSYSWFAKPLEKSLQNPSKDLVEFNVKKFKSAKNVVVLNCIDYLYGHSLLKLLNAEMLLKNSNKLGVVVIIQKFLEWMIPDGLTEAWIAGIPLKNARNYYLNFEEKVNKELKRFNAVYLSDAHSHPSNFDITNFTKVNKHDFTKKNYRITFIWREDRPWIENDYLVYLLKLINFMDPLIWIQNLKIRILFRLLKRKLPDVLFTVIGIGKKTNFPKWVDDVRYSKPEPRDEKKLCMVYSDSRVVIGVHGSNMLLPSAHAGMVVDLMSRSRISNIAEDILYKEETDPRFVSFKYRFLPIGVKFSDLINNIHSMVNDYERSLKYFGLKLKK